MKKRAFFTFVLPLIVFLFLFPWNNRTFWDNDFRFNIFRNVKAEPAPGFELPKVIRIPNRPPLISVIGVPEKIYEYETCYKNENFREEDKSRSATGVTLDFRIKRNGYTHHLEANTTLCLEFADGDEFAVYLPEIVDSNKAFEKDDQYNIQIHTRITVFERPKFGLFKMFLVSISTFFPLYWAGLLAFLEVFKFVRWGVRNN